MKQRPPIYTLDHGIEVIGEYPANGKNRYARLRIRPHRFFPGAAVVSNGILVRKNRVLLAVKLGRELTPEEHAHHSDEDPTNDTAGNLEPLSPAEHNRHHKTGTKHRSESKAKTSASLKKAYAEGRHAPCQLPVKTGEENHAAKLTRQQVIEIRESKDTHTSLARKYGVSRRNIGMIKQGVIWK